MHALGLEFGSAAQLSKRPVSVWNCLWGNALKRSPGIIRKSRVSYPGPGFLSSATWPSLPKKHYNGLKIKSGRKRAGSERAGGIIKNYEFIQRAFRQNAQSPARLSVCRGLYP